MTHTPHELTEDFPGFAERIHQLKASDAHFARLAERYHKLNRAVHRAETNVAPIGAQAETELRKQRAAVKDQIHGILRNT